MDPEASSSSFVVLDSSTSTCTQFSFDILESFSANDCDTADAKEIVCLDETCTGFDTSASFEILDSSIDSAKSKVDNCEDEQLCYLPLTSTPLKPQGWSTLPGERNVKRVHSGTRWEYQGLAFVLTMYTSTS